MRQGAVLAQHRGTWSSCCRPARHTLTGLSARAQGSRFAWSNRSQTQRLSCLERGTDNRQCVVCGEWHRAQRDAVTVALLLVLALRAAGAALLEGHVIRIADGDTPTVLDAEQVQHRVRLAGTDAPEKGQAFCLRSRQNVARLTFGNAVKVR